MDKKCLSFDPCSGAFVGTIQCWINRLRGPGLSPAGKKALHPGRNLMAVHVLQTTGGQFFDAGLAQWYIPKN
ncbi:MAG: hypothetical protein ACP5QA_15145 [Phycisphaerae bacterium]